MRSLSASLLIVIFLFVSFSTASENGAESMARIVDTLKSNLNELPQEDDYKKITWSDLPGVNPEGRKCSVYLRIGKFNDSSSLELMITTAKKEYPYSSSIRSAIFGVKSIEFDYAATSQQEIAYQYRAEPVQYDNQPPIYSSATVSINFSKNKLDTIELTTYEYQYQKHVFYEKCKLQQ